VILAGAGSRIPKLQLMIRRIFGERVLISDRMEDLVVIGATLHASLISQQSSLVMPGASARIPTLSSDLLVERESGHYECLVPEGAPLPCERSHTLLIPQGIQNLCLRFYMNNREHEARQLLAHMVLKELEHRPIHILIHVSIHDNGSLSIHAFDRETQKGAHVDIMATCPDKEIVF
jgi:molecular chaperone DnaK (HSP70)